MHLRNLECSACGQTYDWRRLHNLCACGRPLMPRYDLDAVKARFRREDLRGRPPDLWRYREVLPVPARGRVVTLGEGFTPLLPVDRLGRKFGLRKLFVKEEALNPTGSFKARGMSTAVSMAAVLGAKKLAAPSAGNAAGALAAYAARAGIEAHLFLPADTPEANVAECRTMGARVTLVDGLIDDCGRIVAERKDAEGWFDVSTFKEPYRVEGKKTMGYELAEQLDWRLPDVIIYPTGGGTGLIGMWKAFDEMEQLGWIDARRPRMISVQAEGCDPIVRAFHANQDHAEPFRNARTVAAGLRVPVAVGDFLILRILRASAGTALSVSDEELISGARRTASAEGIFAAPEGGACVAALERLVEDKSVDADERIVLFNTGTGLKYPEAFRADTKKARAGNPAG